MGNFITSIPDLEGYHDCENENLATDVLVPILTNSLNYDRAVGFFSSSSLIETATGLSEIYRKGGHIRMIMSPRLTKEDIDAIKAGYDEREIVEKSMLRDFSDIDDEVCKNRLSFLSHLISNGILDVKIAVFKDDEYTDRKMLHSKIGVCYDDEGNYISFEGSVNETDNGLINNFESMMVFNSWQSTKFSSQIKVRFDEMWGKESKKLKIYPFPEAVKRKLLKYQTFDFQLPSNSSVLEKKQICRDDVVLEDTAKEGWKPQCIDTLYDYQKQAINKWFHQKCIGIFNMATGSGKTFTAYGAICKLLEKKNYHLPVIIVCPYRHLVDQWLEDVDKFHISNVLTGYSGGKNSSYRTKLQSMILDYNDGILPYFVFITTIQSFKLDKLQYLIDEIDGPILLVADEAHNMGSNQIRRVLDDKYKYRIALSATIDRHGDSEGTSFLHSYFGDECIRFTLGDAIAAGSLCEYNYYPILTYLNQDERVEYIKLTQELSKCIIVEKSGVTKLKHKGKIIALKRARLIAGSNGKLQALKGELLDHTNEFNMLVYCGTSNVETDSGDEIRQIEDVCLYLGKELKMKIGRYTSKETPEQRIQLKKRFESGDDLQVLVAIKCLDEGVNIPSIKTAFILASSTNPREYIQRRGRVLRHSSEKSVANIYDFITLPMPSGDLTSSVLDLSSFKTLVSNEIIRMKEFASEAINSGNVYSVIENIKQDYGFYDFDNIEYEAIDWSDDDDE